MVIIFYELLPCTNTERPLARNNLNLMLVSSYLRFQMLGKTAKVDLSLFNTLGSSFVCCFIEKTSNITRCYMAETCGEMVPPPLKLFVVVDEESTVNMVL